MKRDLLEQAIIGSDNQAQILLHAANVDVIQRASHGVMKHIGVSDLTYRVENPVPPEAVRYLRLILNGVYHNVLHEWVTLVHAAGYQPSAEVVYLLTRFVAKVGSFYLKWMESIKSLMGDEGIVLALSLLETDDMPLYKFFVSSIDNLNYLKKLFTDPVIIDYSRYDEHDPMVHYARRLNGVVLDRWTSLREVGKIQQVWSTDLMDAFYKVIMERNDDLTMINLVTCSHFFQLDSNLTLTKWLQNVPTFSPASSRVCRSTQCLEKIHKARLVLEFRRQMVAAIQQGR